MYSEISITALSKAVNNLAKSFKDLGFETQVEVFKSGRSEQYYGPSRVEFTIRKADYFSQVTFIANGHGPDDLHRGEIGGTKGWKHMKREAVDYLLSGSE